MRPIVSSFFGSLVLLVAVPAGAQFRPLALHGDPIPGHPDETVGLTSGILPLGGDRAAFVVRTQTARDEVVVFDDGRTQTAVAMENEPAPGGGTFGVFGELRPVGTGIAFVTSMAGADTLFRVDPEAGLREVIAAGDVVPGGGTVADIGLFSGSDRGEILVDAGGGIVFVDPSGMMGSVLRPLDPIPGDPTFMVDFIDRAEISSGGLVTIYVRGTNAGRSLFRSYILQGTGAALAPIASTLDIPLQTGDMGLLAISRSGAVAYTFLYTTDDTGTTIEHRELWIESGGSAVRALEVVGGTTFTVGGRTMSWVFGGGLLADDQRLFVQGESATLTVLGSALEAVHFDSDPLPGGAAASPLVAVGVSSLGVGLFSGGSGGATALYRWSASAGLALVTGTGETLPTRDAPVTATQIGTAQMAGDAQIELVAAYQPDATTVSGIWMTGVAELPETDLRAVRFGSPGTPDAAGLDAGVYNLVLEVENRGPSDAAFEVRFVEARVVPINPTACSVSGGDCTCSGDTCTTDRVVRAGETVAMALLYAPGERAPHITATVVPIGADETNPADNEIELGGAPGGGGCSIARGRSAQVPLALLALAAVLVVARRRRAVE